MQHLISSLSVGDYWAPVSWCTGHSPAESDDTRGSIYTIM